VLQNPINVCDKATDYTPLFFRIRSEDSTSTWKVFPLGLPEMLHKNFLDAVLQHPRVIKVSQTLYGISDSMHTLRLECRNTCILFKHI